MKKLLLLFVFSALLISANAQNPFVTITDANDTTETAFSVGAASEVTFKYDITPKSATIRTIDTIFIDRYLLGGEENPYRTAGDTIVVNDSVGTVVKTYSTSPYGYFKATSYTDTTSTATLKGYRKLK